MLPEKKVEATRGIWSSPRRLRVSPGGHRGGLWPSRVRRTGSRWWLWYLPKCPPDPEREGFRRPSDREDIDYRGRGQLGLATVLYLPARTWERPYCTYLGDGRKLSQRFVRL